MRIDKYIDTRDFTKELSPINHILNGAQASISFWGKRFLAIPGYQGSISLNDVVLKVWKAARQRSQADDLTTAERVAGIEIVNKLKKFYEITDTKISHANWFTRLLNAIREFGFTYARFYAEESTEHYFRGYSETKFVQEFGGSKKNTLGDYHNSDGSFGPPLRILALEKCIRAKLPL